MGTIYSGVIFLALNSGSALSEVARRIRELRLDMDYSEQRMAELTGISLDDYLLYEAGGTDLPFTFIHKCALTFGVEIVELLEGSSTRLTGYSVTRRGGGSLTSCEPGTEIRSIAPLFKNRKADPYWVRYEYSEAEQNAPIHQVTHNGQEFDMIIEGHLKIKIGEHVEILAPGDSIYYDSSSPHGMIAIDGQDCTFLAVILAGDEDAVVWDHGRLHDASALAAEEAKRLAAEVSEKTAPDFMDEFIHVDTDENGVPEFIRFENEDRFNFAFDVVDKIADREPDRLAMVHLDREKTERRFTFGQMKKMSARAANYFRALGIQKGDRVMLVMRRNWEFWPVIIGLHKLGAIAIPATDQLVEKDFEYRFRTAEVNAIVCSAYGSCSDEAERAAAKAPSLRLKVISGGKKDGWHCFDEEYEMYSSRFARDENSICGDESMLMLFTSGTSGYPKAAVHSCKYPLGHYLTAKHWHCVDPEGLHLTISDTGWGKALWGKLYGQWMCGAATFVYDFDRFSAEDLLPLFGKYGITTFCAPPTMYRFFIKEDLSKYDLSSVRHASIAGEAMNPEVYEQFRRATGIAIREAFGQTETTMVITTFAGTKPKPGSMGKPSPQYDVELLNADGQPCGLGEVGEIVIFTGAGVPCGLFKGYLNDPEATARCHHDGYYHTGDLAWRDEDGYYWYVGRADDVIKSSGYRIGPFEIESVLMELPYVLECGVSAAPDPIRGQVVKASIVLVSGTIGTDELKKDIQDYVKKRTAPYKYPRIVEFRESLPKTTSGKIQRNLL